MQKIKRSLVTTLAVIGLAGSLSADHYVAQNGQTPVYPYNTQGNAASNIQVAVDAADAGSTVWVAPGTYYASAEPADSSVVSIRKSLTLRSTTGNPADVIVDGDATYRCLYVHASADMTIVVDGLTLTNGFFSAGAKNTGGAGVFFAGAAGGAATLQNSVITGNTLEKSSSEKDIGGGGIYANTTAQIVVSNCTVLGNQTLEGGDGGGVRARYDFLIIDSLIAQNKSAGNAGGLYLRGATAHRCNVISNTTDQSVSTGIYLLGGAEISNTLVVYNERQGIYVYDSARIFNCTSVLNGDYGIYFHDKVVSGIMDNCIIDTILYNYAAIATCYNNCIPSVPAHGDWINSVLQVGDSMADRLDFIKFVGWENGNFRLEPNSPCVNAGIDRENQFPEALDLDRKPRIDRFSKVVDIGCYEYLPSGMLFYLK